jgi:hypothetical protein
MVTQCCRNLAYNNPYRASGALNEGFSVQFAEDLAVDTSMSLILATLTNFLNKLHT